MTSTPLMMPTRCGVGIASGVCEFPSPDIQGGAAVALGQQVALEAGGTAGASGRHGGHPKRRAAFLHEAGGDLHVLKLVALAAIGKPLSGEAELEHLQALVGKGCAPADGNPEARKFVGRVADADAQLDTAVA